MKKTIILLFTLIATSCIPYKIAPKFKNKDYKIMKAKKFQRKLPNETSYIFKDPKDANEFYNYLNTKYNLNHVNVGLNTTININNSTYNLTYHEVERTDEIANVGLVVTDLVLEEKTGLTAFENNYSSRTGHWYIIITVYDESLKNCLLEKHPKHKEIVSFLRELQQEYLRTYNYEELRFTKKS
ncbi:MAG: hypothetical protein HRU49_04070 [Winogradskyella sp.]|uniref:hypothetical protein n=1 Tax=Winogradskyella sp. TaxID=1883156 RepID=UPI0025E7AAAE|nr:hypothetical protein [Winogradskyella sp.]NRB82939.1 hypothetical protein [Winogradskyella sp.]